MDPTFTTGSGVARHEHHRLDGGVFYLPRLFVYHCGRDRVGAVGDLQGDGTAASKAIMNPP